MGNAGLATSFKKSLFFSCRGVGAVLHVGNRGVRTFANKILRCCFKNYNYREASTGVPQPRQFNSTDELDIFQTLGIVKWLGDVQNSVTNEKFVQLYHQKQYGAMSKAFFPNRTSAFEIININRVWQSSYWNESVAKSEDKFQKYRYSDALFADMMANTQGIYKIKKVKGEQITARVKNTFKNFLEEKRGKLGNFNEHKCIVDELIEADNLFYLDYPELREVEDQSVRQFIKSDQRGEKYHVKGQSLTGEAFNGYLEIPFVLFANVPNYDQGKERFVAIASVFNESDEIYHPFDEEDMVLRDRWEMAKCHIAHADMNYFTTRTHLGILHYSSALFTTAFVNVAKDQSLKWMKNNFIDMFTQGMLQTNFLANKTLIDKDQPVFDSILYLRLPQTKALIEKHNSKFDVLKFNPYDLGKDSYKGDAVRISQDLYERYRYYIEYLFEVNRDSWEGKCQKIGQQIYDEVHGGEFNALSDEICRDETPETLKKLMLNLAYNWCVHHGETFSLISVGCNYFLVPSLMRKPLSHLGDKPLTADQKQQWLGSLENIKDGSNLNKSVTFRKSTNSILSNWNDDKFCMKTWNKVRRQIEKNPDLPDKNFTDHWDKVILDTHKINNKRTDQGLFHLHWLQVSELPHALNV